MNRGPTSGSTTIDHVAKAHASWGDPPDWVLAAAVTAQKTSLRATGALIGYSASTISELISNRYRGDLGKVEEMIRGALLGATVMCPVLDEIGRDQCRREQTTPFRATNSTRARLRRACRTCSNNQTTGDRHE